MGYGQVQKPIVKDNLSIAKDILNKNKNLTTVKIIDSCIKQSTIITPITIHINSVTDTIAGGGQNGTTSPNVAGGTITPSANGAWIRRVAASPGAAALRGPGAGAKGRKKH
ncbi:hypothetical protein ACFFJY_05660 [Fictibacillus aquaticus]|uniref:Uncharacterized protein n=1 Tax=Fictibacillus aquaticus TaxID=2021314 RepID=A0A235F3T7_9BACL|nr:hypothetical protein [Fictibacillus aquaticus]OYD55936.1 hypothetical protein CGZ90_20245 [Fictibacillus aquaticus]